MGYLYARLQEIIGEKIFRHKVTFDGDVVFKKHITAHAPLGSEPSYGEPHPHAATILDTDPDSTAVTSVDISDIVPVGTKAISGFITMTSTTANDYVQVCNSDASIGYGIARAQVANVTNDGWFMTPVTADRKIYYNLNDVRVTLARLRMRWYYT